MANKNLGWIIAILFVAAYIALPGFQEGVKGIFKPGVPTVDGVCLFDGTTLEVGPLEYKFSPTTSAATETSMVYKKDNGRLIEIGSKNKTQTIETQPGDEYKIIYADSSSIFYATEVDIVVPCAAAFSTAEVDGGKYQIVANKSPSVTVFNDDDGLSNTATNNESMTTDDVANFDVKIVYAAKSGWSPFGNNIITIQVNSTTITDVELSSAEVDVTTDDVPSFRSANNATAGMKMYAFSHAGIETKSTKTIRYTMTLESGSTEPALEWVYIFLDDEDYYRDSDTGLPEFGVETEDDADVGHTTEVLTRVIID